MSDLTLSRKIYIDNHYKADYVSDMARVLGIKNWQVAEYMEEKGYYPKKSGKNNFDKKMYVKKDQPAPDCFNYNEKLF